MPKDFAETLHRITPILLIVFNVILVGAGWMLAVYTYPRLPDAIPLWLGVRDGEPVLVPKSPLFFLYPALQTAIAGLFIWLGRRAAARSKTPRLALVKQEQYFLSLIFVNLIFIHLLRSLIGLTLLGVSVLNWPFFFGLLLIISVLFFYYRWQAKVLSSAHDGGLGD